MESISSHTLAEEAMQLVRLAFLASRSICGNNPALPRANSLHFHVLFMLLNLPHAAITMSQLAAATIASKQQISRLISGMEKKGLVRRELNPLNRRQILVHILPAGRAMAEEILEEMCARIAYEAEIFSEQEKQELYTSFMTFQRLLEKVATAQY
ncbi:MAG: MarR family transcriptional regulator [Clostridiales bacterium]|nr:MarR family transcriptional regulator [Clostridiales bacterium]